MKLYFTSLYLFIQAIVYFSQINLNAQSSNLKIGTTPSFTENKGQIADSFGNTCDNILFYTEEDGTRLFITTTGLSYVLYKTEKINNQGNEQLKYLTHRVDMTFIGASTTINHYGTDVLSGYKNFYYPHCKNGITQVKNYASLVYNNVYRNIDVIYKAAKSKGLKYDIIVRPGGNVGDIAINYSGQEGLTIKNGNLIIGTSLGELTEFMPKVYQNINGKIKDIEAWYEFTHEKNVVIKTATYNKNYSLVIDPWVTYFGGSLNETAQSVTTDLNGNVIFTGQTESINFPVLGAYQSTNGGSANVYITKMSESGNLIWSTYYGGSYIDVGIGISTDKTTGDVYVTGNALSTDFPTGAAAAQTSYMPSFPGTGAAAFLLKLSSAGVRLWATFYGDASGSIDAADVDTDQAGDVIMVGRTNATAGIATAGAFQTSFAGGVQYDAYAVKFSSTGSRVWASYCGGTDTESACGISCDASNNIYLLGLTRSTNFPITPGAHQTALGGDHDNFLFKFNSGGQQVWATYYGGSGAEGNRNAIQVDLTGNIYFGGQTPSLTGISTPASFQPVRASSNDGYFAKFNSSGVRQWATYLGGAALDNVNGLAVDANNNILVGGNTLSADFPVTSCAFQTTITGTNVQYVSSFDPNGSLICSTFMGNGYSLTPKAGGCIASSGRYVYLVAYTSCGYPTTANAYQSVCSGGDDAALAQLCVSSCGYATMTANFSASDSLLCEGNGINFSLQISSSSCGVSNTTYYWSFPGATTSFSTSQNPTNIIYQNAGSFPVKVVIETPCIKDSVEKIAYINVNSSPTATITGTATVCAGDTTTLTVSGGSTYQWNTGATTSSVLISPTTQTSYSVIVFGASSCSDTAIYQVSVNAMPLANIAAPSGVCSGNSAMLSASGGNSFVWSTGATTSVISVTPTTSVTYSLIAINSCGNDTSAAIINVNALPLVVCSGNAAFCEGTSIVISAGGAISYSWFPAAGLSSTAGNSVSASPTASAQYTVVATDSNGCSNYCTINLTELPIPNVDAGNDVIISSGENTQLSASGTGTHNWYPSNGLSCTNCANPIANPGSTTTYYVEYTDNNGCIAHDSVTIIVELNCNEDIFVPNAFSPNNDGQNDELNVYGSCLKSISFIIYDRWGNKLFETNDMGSGWNGAYSGNDMDTGVYVYKLSAVTNTNMVINKSGNISLIR